MRRSLLLGCAFVSGCATSNMTELVKAMAGDPATVCARINGPAPYLGELTVFRTNLTNGKVSCNQEGMTVSSETTNVSGTVTLVQPKEGR